MQLKKQHKKLTREPIRVPVKLFHPVIPKGLEITWATLSPKATHVVITTRVRPV